MINADDKVYVRSIGTRITLDCKQDISAATACSINVRKPDGSTVVWPAVVSGTTEISFVVPDADTLDQRGRYVLQADVTLPAGHWPGASAPLVVFDRFN